MFALVLVLGSGPVPSVALKDLERFPPVDACQYLLQVSTKHVDHARFRLATEPARAAYWQQRLKRGERSQRAWRALLQAHGGLGSGSTQSRLAGLQRLRKMLSDDAYFLGVMP